MKKILNGFLFSVFGLALVGAFQSSMANTQPMTKATSMVPEHVYVPPGFDDNDNSQVIFEGEFLTTCTQVGPTEYFIDESSMTIKIDNVVYEHDLPFCLQTIVPYKKVVNLGQLKSGKWKVYFKTDQANWAPEKMIEISAAPHPALDDFTYGPVDQAFVINKGTATQPDYKLTLKGLIQSDCMHFDHVKVLQREKNVVEVLPVMQIEKRNNCRSIESFFTREIDLPNTIKGRKLIHVRVLNGGALNEFYSFKK